MTPMAAMSASAGADYSSISAKAGVIRSIACRPPPRRRKRAAMPRSLAKRMPSSAPSTDNAVASASASMQERCQHGDRRERIRDRPAGARIEGVRKPAAVLLDIAPRVARGRDRQAVQGDDGIEIGDAVALERDPPRATDPA